MKAAPLVTSLRAFGLGAALSALIGLVAVALGGQAVPYRASVPSLSVGTGKGVGTLQPMEIIGTDGGLSITSTNTARGTESYVAAYLKDANGNYQKIGASAWQWTNRSVTNGYASWNIHTSKMTNGKQTDHVGLTVWASHGAAFFAQDLSAASAPGDRILKVNGYLTADLLRSTGMTFATLPPSVNGSITYCSDCTPETKPCTGRGTGAMAKRLAGAWDCR